MIRTLIGSTIDRLIIETDVRTKMYKGRRILIFDRSEGSEYGKGPQPDVIRSQGDVISVRESGATPQAV